MLPVENKENPESGRYGTSGRQMVRLSMAVACLAPFGAVCVPALPVLAMTASCPNKIDFGKFAIAGGIGNLTVTPGSAVPAKPSVVTITAPKPGVCKVAGFTGTTGTLKVQVTATKANMTFGGNVMTVEDFNIGSKNAGRTKNYFSVSLTKTSKTYHVGARLHIGGGDSSGHYTGSVIIIHTYTN